MTVRVFARPTTFGDAKEGGAYSRFKLAIKDQCRDLQRWSSAEVSVVLKLFILRSRVGPNRNDLDNFPKAIIDALAEAGALEESQIASIWIERVMVDGAEDEGVEISMRPHSSTGGPAG